jgi:hypothetical protein
MAYPPKSFGSFLLGVLLALASPVDAARLINISTRMQVLDGDGVAIAGFIIEGTTNKTVVVTAKGPSLAAYGIDNALADPTVTLVRMSDQATLAVNDNWSTAANAAQVSSSGFAPSNALESAIMATLAPGAYTAIVSGTNHTTGVGLVEVYEVNQPAVTLTNISTRGQVGTGGDVMIAGFVVAGPESQKVIVTAKGPSLATYGITNALPDPQFTLVRATDQSYVANNDNWAAFELADDLRFSGFAPSDARESAVLVTLPPGAYTAIVSGAGEINSGVGIVEVWAWDGVGQLAQPNTSAVHRGFNGVTYAYHLPRSPNGLYGSGFLQQGTHPLTPSELTIEWAISKVPGDFDYYLSPAASVGGQTPCGGINGAVGGTYYWSVAGSFYECKVDNVNKWYLNVRYLDNCPPGARCPVSYYHSES